ncbi:relaxin-3-like [Girardinichthys multiradiatus]|uniref:relaxin-3-like n=1 Tax=Girardinichthys multiradiatus TaxID=208333 RepID=UPI001FADF3C6|nr:relaxin-3-like [Girardinichthys multiradiatus]XP_047224466.1 relaxin-3-like [Girardinichthys multiradiatus]
MNNMRSSLQLGVLLCVLCAAHVQAQENRNSLRLCGRALVRALVFTCGGSRWRRQLEEKGFLPDEFLAVNREEPDFLKTGDVPVTDFHQRDQDQALITMCCQQGCQRRELSMLC